MTGVPGSRFPVSAVFTVSSVRLPFSPFSSVRLQFFQLSAFRQPFLTFRPYDRCFRGVLNVWRCILRDWSARVTFPVSAVFTVFGRSAAVFASYRPFGCRFCAVFPLFVRETPFSHFSPLRTPFSQCLGDDTVPGCIGHFWLLTQV